MIASLGYESISPINHQQLYQLTIVGISDGSRVGANVVVAKRRYLLEVALSEKPRGPSAEASDPAGLAGIRAAV